MASAPGSVSQVRASAHELTSFAKRRGTSVILVGHVTKDGQIAGPRVVEHMVDAVLYFEGERSHQFRILRTVKNRFGPTDEIGVFEMAREGLVEVANPSELFLAQRQDNVAGSAVLAAQEGTRASYGPVYGPIGIGPTLEAVKTRGFLQCGVNTGLPGFAVADAKGKWTGMDVEVCRAVAAAVLGDAQAVKFIPVVSACHTF